MVEFDQVTVCHPDVVDPADSMFPPELSILRHTSPRPGEGALPNLPFSFPPPEHSPPSLNRDLRENIDPEDHQDVHIAHSVQCEDTKMVVSIEKETLKVSKTYNINNM